MKPFALVVIGLLVQGNLRSTKWYGAFAAIADAPVIIIMVIAAFAFGDRVPGIDVEDELTPSHEGSNFRDR